MPREQRLGQIVHRFRAVVLLARNPPPIRRPRCGLGARKSSMPMRILVPQLEQAGGEQRQDLGGHHHHQAVGQGDQAAALAHEGDAEVVVGADDVVRAGPDRGSGRAPPAWRRGSCRGRPRWCSLRLVRSGSRRRGAGAIRGWWRMRRPWRGNRRWRARRCRRR